MLILLVLVTLVNLHFIIYLLLIGKQNTDVHSIFLNF